MLIRNKKKHKALACKNEVGLRYLFRELIQKG